ncbi:rhizopuspepsin-1 precursor [Phaeosphaeria sp. MPI-PUGE-AT-0046c]|nr:rhizopuspepsin-1 precursor [Phaeosphaeria sp. MPI-PUGE-AT-0046c]
MVCSLPSWLALSAAFLQTTLAFYPYQLSGDRPASHRRLPHPATDTRSLTLPLRRVPSRRQNAYNIVNSVDPKQANSVAVDQDGGDLSYMVAVKIGDSKEEYHLLLDSAASNTWVMGQDCKSEACGQHNTFGRGDSGTLKTQSDKFSITYGTGSVSGTLASDTFHIGPLSPSLTFGLATTVSAEFSSYPMDGILGIGRGPGSPILLDTLAASKLISSKQYGIHLSRATDGTADGELNIGQLNKERFSGDINYIKAVDTSTGFWEIPIDNAGVDGKSLGLTSRTAVIDTGTSFILTPPLDAQALHANIPGHKQDGETFSVPCDTRAVMQFTFNKQVYNISTADWRGGKLDSGLCRSNIVGRQTFGDKQWLVGDVFLKNVYTVLDADQGRVGFGVKSSVQEQSKPSSASSSASASASAGVKPSQTGTIVSGSASRTSAAGSQQAAPSTAAVEGTEQGQKTDAKSAGSRLRRGRGVAGSLVLIFVFMVL